MDTGPAITTHPAVARALFLRGRMGGMPTRRDQLNRMLADLDRQIAEAEVEMLSSLADENLRQLLEKQVDLRLLRDEVEKKLKDENNPPLPR